MRSESLTSLRRVALLERADPTVRPIGIFPAQVHDYDEWSTLAVVSQQKLREETEGLIEQTA